MRPAKQLLRNYLTTRQGFGGAAAAPNPFLMRAFLRFFFYLLYHPFALTYDLVAATVSLGRWKDWVLSVVPFIKGNRILEIGHGPGHLQRILLSRNLFTVGIDESTQMGRLAKRNLTRFFATKTNSNSTNQHHAYAQVNLTRGVAQQLPFPNGSFNTVVATFPAEYIFESETLMEASRVLTTGGQFVILPGATIMGRSLIDRVLALLFRVTRQTPPNLSEILHERSKESLAKAGFHVEVHEIEVKSSLVFIMLATKTMEETQHA